MMFDIMKVFIFSNICTKVEKICLIMPSFS